MQLDQRKEKTGYIPSKVVPINIDVTGLYPSIPLDEGLLAFKEALKKRQYDPNFTDFIMALLELVLTANVGEFDDKWFLQTWGTSMGSKCSPSESFYCFVFRGTGNQATLV